MTHREVVGGPREGAVTRGLFDRLDWLETKTTTTTTTTTAPWQRGALTMNHGPYLVIRLVVDVNSAAGNGRLD